MTTARKTLETAAEFVAGDRQETYGDPDKSFRAVAAMWDQYLAARPGSREQNISSSDVACMMVLLKLVRQANKPKTDNLVDAAAYAALAEEVSGTPEARWLKEVIGR